jgi:hypothetical protein
MLPHAKMKRKHHVGFNAAKVFKELMDGVFVLRHPILE